MLQELFVRLAVQATGTGDPLSPCHAGAREVLQGMALDAQLNTHALVSALSQAQLQTTLHDRGLDRGGNSGLGGTGVGGLV